MLEPAALEGTQVTATLETDGGDQSLDFGAVFHLIVRTSGSKTHSNRYLRLGVRLSVLLLCALNLPTNNVFPDIVFLRQVEEPPDLGCSLGTETLGEDVVGQSRNIVLALLDNDDGEDSNIGADNAATDGFALALTSAAGAVARVTVGQKETDTVGKEDTLLHGETLLVVTAGNTENVTFPFVTEGVGGDFLSDPLLVEDTAANQEFR